MVHPHSSSVFFIHVTEYENRIKLKLYYKLARNFYVVLNHFQPHVNVATIDSGLDTGTPIPTISYNTGYPILPTSKTCFNMKLQRGENS